MKICKYCGKNYELDKFVKNKECKNGRAGICRNCQNKYSRDWKQRNRDKLLLRRRKDYAERYKPIHKKKEELRKKQYPLRCRCQVLRQGMADRSRKKDIGFDKQFFTVSYLMSRLTKNPCCECCGKRLDIGFKKDKKFNDNSPSMDRVNSLKGYTKDNVAILCWRCNKHKQGSTSKELRMIADFMDIWGDEVESDILL